MGLIVDAVLAGLSAETARADSPAPAHKQPDKLVRVFAAKDAGAPGGGWRS